MFVGSVESEVQSATGANCWVLIEADRVQEVYSSGASCPAAQLSRLDCFYGFLALLTAVSQQRLQELNTTDSVTGHDDSAHSGGAKEQKSRKIQLQ